MTTPYAAIPVGPEGLQPDRAQVVFGSPLRDTMSRAELARQVSRLLVENDRLRQVDPEQALERLDAECELRIRAERRLRVAAMAFDAIVRHFPQTAAIIDQAREDIWG